jgi:hypothetical protein
VIARIVYSPSFNRATGNHAHVLFVAKCAGTLMTSFMEALFPCPLSERGTKSTGQSTPPSLEIAYIEISETTSDFGNLKMSETTAGPVTGASPAVDPAPGPLSGRLYNPAQARRTVSKDQG